MPAYETFVTTMTATSKKNREAALGNLWAVFKHLPKVEQLNVGEEPGLLAAVEPFLRGDKAETALDLLNKLGELEVGEVTETTRKCAAAIFDSPCLSTVKDLAETGSTVKLKREAWAVIGKVSCMEEERMKELLDSAGMVALLQAGMESEDDIATYATAATTNLCCNIEVASDVLNGHPDLVKAFVKAFSIGGTCYKFRSESQPPLSFSLHFLMSILLRSLSF